MKAQLLVSCPDQLGIIARFSDVLFQAKANILTLEEHTEHDWFFMRTSIDADISQKNWLELQARLKQLAKQLQADLEIFENRTPTRLALLVTSEAACPQDLLGRYKAGELNCEISLIISNSPDLRELAQTYNIPFVHVPYDDDTQQAEQAILKHLQEAAIETIILARFMKVLSPEFVHAYPSRIINIHHGFLPAFKGSNPYRQAWEHGVKVIGATAHFVTANLDEGPIIHQEVISVTHQSSVRQMIQAGQDIERRVLSGAVAAYLEHRIILHGRRTVVFR